MSHKVDANQRWSAQDHRGEYELQGCIEKISLEASADGPPDWKTLSVTAIAAENSSVGEYVANLQNELAEAQRTIADLQAKLDDSPENGCPK